ncbi:MAG: hypothetical protein Ct9H300mP8_08540 [Gammaproteobacteria bacterium]|nr:MAG: hypothetical protein Ct9H300mP8_08540 [Gammaproteobacteria bacterium]
MAGIRSIVRPRQELLAEEAITRMDEAGVDAAILVPPSWEGDRNDVCLDAALRFPDRFAVMGRFPSKRSPNETGSKRGGNKPACWVFD